MEKLYEDVIRIIVNFLNKKSIINFLSINKLFRQYFYLFYEKYYTINNKDIYMNKTLLGYINMDDFIDNFYIKHRKNIFEYSYKLNKIKLVIYKLNYDLINDLYKYVHCLTIIESYEKDSLKYIPKNVKHIKILFNQDIDILPDHIDSLHIEGEYRRDIKRLPSNLRKFYYNGLHINVVKLPESLEYLKVGKMNICNFYLPNLKKIKLLSYDFIYYEYLLPNCIQSLKIIGLLEKSIKRLPDNLKELYLIDKIYEYNLKFLPQSLEILYINTIKKIKEFPKNLRYLYLGNYYNSSLNNLPNYLEILEVGYHFNRSLNILPKNLKKLILGWCYQKNISLPDSLEVLKFRGPYKKHIKYFPKKLRKIYIYSKYPYLDEIPKNINVIFHKYIL